MSLADEPMADRQIDAAAVLLSFTDPDGEHGPARERIVKALRDHRELYAEWRDILQAIEGGLGVMTATPAKTIREHGVRLTARVRELEENQDLVKAGQTIDRMRAENKAQAEKIEHLEARQQEHLKMISSLSQSVPLESEVREALAQRGVLLAEIGTLRAKVTAAEASDAAHGDARMTEFYEYKARRNEQHAAYDALGVSHEEALTKIADLEKQIETFKDRSVALHQIWFGTPGAFTPEMLAVERERFAMALIAASTARSHLDALLAKITAYAVASREESEADARVDELGRVKHAAGGVLFDYAADLMPDEDAIDPTHEHAFDADETAADCELCGHGRAHYLHREGEGHGTKP